MAIESYLKAPIVVTYRSTERSKIKKIKILRGKTLDNFDKLINMKIHGIKETTVIDHIGIGYKFIPKDKLSVADRKIIQKRKA